MKKKRHIALAIILSLSSLNKTYASCTQEQINEFNRIKEQYKIITTYNSETQTYNMRIEEANPDKFGYVFTIDHQYSCNEVSDTVTECTGLKPGSEFYARVIGLTNECNDYLLKEEKIKLIKNNKYYGDPLCEGIEEFVLCQQMYDKDIERETFESRIETYKKSKQEKIEKEKQEQANKKKENIVDKTTNYIKENLVQVIIVTVFIILVIITTIITIISSKKSRRLE